MSIDRKALASMDAQTWINLQAQEQEEDHGFIADWVI